MISRRSLNFGQNGPGTVKLSALERLRNTPKDLQLGKRRCHFFSAVFDRILLILAGNNDIHKSLDEF